MNRHIYSYIHIRVGDGPADRHHQPALHCHHLARRALGRRRHQGNEGIMASAASTDPAGEAAGGSCWSEQLPPAPNR